MSARRAVVVASATAERRIGINRGQLAKPTPLPVRPLPVDQYRMPAGKKEIFLPNFVITFLHTPKLDPKFASFLVPLWFSKFDLKDYLFHMYGVKALRIRSYVMQSKVREGRPHDLLPKPRNWFRPQSTKKMTIEMVEGEPGQGPFVWPAEPKDWTPWSKNEYEKQLKINEKQQQRQDHGHKMPPPDVGLVRRQAAEALRKARSRSASTGSGTG